MMTWKKVQNRYKRILGWDNAHDNDNLRLSGVGGGEMGEIADLFMNLCKARIDMLAQKMLLA